MAKVAELQNKINAMEESSVSMRRGQSAQEAEIKRLKSALKAAENAKCVAQPPSAPACLLSPPTRPLVVARTQILTSASSPSPRGHLSRRQAAKETEDARAALETVAKDKPKAAAASKIPTTKASSATASAPAKAASANKEEMAKLKASVKQLNKEKTRVRRVLRLSPCPFALSTALRCAFIHTHTPPPPHPPLSCPQLEQQLAQSSARASPARGPSGDSDKLKKKVKELERQLSQAPNPDDFAALNEKCDELEEEIASLRQAKMQLSELKSAQSTLQQRLEAAELERNQLQAALDEKSAEQASPSVAAEELEVARQDLQELQTRYEDLADENNTTVQRLEEELATLSRRADQDASELEDLREVRCYAEKGQGR